MLMMRPPPPWAIICLAASWVPKNALFRFTAMHLLELRLGGVEHRGAGLDARVVDHDVEPTEVGDRRVDHALEVLDLGDVRLDPDRRLSQAGDLALQLLLRLLVGDVVDDDLGPLLGQRQHHRRADPGVATGDDGDLALQLLCHGAPPSRAHAGRSLERRRARYRADRPPRRAEGHPDRCAPAFTCLSRRAGDRSPVRPAPGPMALELTATPRFPSIGTVTDRHCRQSVRQRSFPPSPTTGSSRTARTAVSWPRTARSSGCASRGRTRPASSAPSSTARPATSASGPPAPSCPTSGATCPGPWCSRRRGTPRRAGCWCRTCSWCEPVTDGTRRPDYRRAPGDAAATGTLLRLATCIEGHVEVVANVVPVFEYGVADRDVGLRRATATRP